MANLIASGTTQADSADFTVTAGVPVTLFLTTADGNLPGEDARARVQIKSDGGQYHTVGELTRNQLAAQLDSPGTYRVRKLETRGAAYAVDKNE